MSRKRRNEDELVNDATKHFHLNDTRFLNDTRKLLQTEEVPTAVQPTLSNKNMQIINDNLEEIIKYSDSLPTEKKLTEDEILEILTFGLNHDANFRELFQADETNITYMIKRRIRSHLTNNGSSSSTVNSTSDDKLNINDLDIFWTEVLQILQDHIDTVFQKNEQRRYQKKLVDRVIIHLRLNKRARELFKIKIDITDIYRILSCATRNGRSSSNSDPSVSPEDTLSRDDLISFVENVMELTDDFKDQGFLDQSSPLSDPLYTAFINFLKRADSHLRN